MIRVCIKCHKRFDQEDLQKKYGKFDKFIGPEVYKPRKPICDDCRHDFCESFRKQINDPTKKNIKKCERCKKEFEYRHYDVGQIVMQISPGKYKEILVCDKCRKEISNKILKGIKNESNDTMDER